WNAKSFAETGERKASEEGEALCNKKTDAMIYAAGNPNGTVQQVTSLCNARLISVEGPDVATFIRKHPFSAQTTNPANMYHANTRPVKTFGVTAVVFASQDLDPQIAYQIVKSVFDNLDNFKTLHPVFATLDAKTMVETAQSIAPLHEGAAKYFREKGL